MGAPLHAETRRHRDLETDRHGHTHTPTPTCQARPQPRRASPSGGGGPGAGRGQCRRREEVPAPSLDSRASPPAGRAMEAEPPLYPVAGAAGPQGDEDRLGVPDGPEAPVSGDAGGVGARAPGGPGSPRREWDAAPAGAGSGAGRGSGRDVPLRAAVVPRSWTSWWARTPTTTRRRRSAATTAASGSACSRTCWRPARAACSPTASTWVGGRRRAPLGAGWAPGPARRHCPRAPRGDPRLSHPPPAPSADLFLRERETSASLPLSLLDLRPRRCSCGAPSVGASRGGGQPRPSRVCGRLWGPWADLLPSSGWGEWGLRGSKVWQRDAGEGGV